ncbi:tail fiber protein [Vibrio phage X29]|uniref:tail protein n=1 Tax=Vibrio phage X29 TaxID=1500713 RepID=UPI00045FC4A5|nr:tail protein [Vibrio phage X29]AIA10319.1 tail fiber protein [Vibrio phage X29]
MASILTTVGRNKLASATPEQQLTISHIAVGDGNGDFPPLNPSMTSLVNEVWRGAASQPIRTADLGTLIFEGFIPGNIGGFFIREIAIFDNTGAMIAIGQTSVVEKPDPSSGSVVTIAPRLHVKLDNADQVDLIVQDVPYIDHAGLSNRSAADSHPATAISVDALPAIGFNNPTTVQAALSALKSAATKESQSSKTDAAANKLMLTGAFGLGGEAIASSNWNNITVSGFYTNSTSNQAELPIAALPLSLIHIQAGTNATQICGRTASDEPQMWRRSKQNGTWGAWVEFADQRYRFISDANLAVKSGLYSLPISAGALNAPVPNASGTLLVIQGGSGENFVSQMWTQSSDLTAERVFVRHKTSSGWTDWVEVYHTGNLPEVTQGEAEGTSSALRAWSPLRVRQAIEAWARTVNDEVGVVKYFISTVTPTGRYIKANGAAVSRTAYADLFAKVGTFWGAGDGSTTFNVPDLRGEFIRSWDDGRGIDAGRAFGSTQNENTPSDTMYRINNISPAFSFANGPMVSGSLITNATFKQANTGDNRPRNVALIAWIGY